MCGKTMNFSGYQYLGSRQNRAASNSMRSDQIHTGLDRRIQVNSETLYFFLFLQNANTYLGGVKVNADDITSNVYKIRDYNSNNGIFVRNKNFTTVDVSNTSCCNYEYFVLNTKCKQMVSNIFLSREPIKSTNNCKYLSSKTTVKHIVQITIQH